MTPAGEGDPGAGERELEDFLRRVPPEAPDELRREQARRAFLAGGVERRSRPRGFDRTGGTMPLESHSIEASESDGFVAWLAARAPAEAPRAELVRRARLAFLAVIASEVAPPLRTRRPFRGLVLALAAAAMVAVTLLLPEPARWSVRLEGPLIFAEETYAPGDDARLAAELEGPGMLETGPHGVRLALGESLALEVLPRSAFTLHGVPDLDGVSHIEFELARGEAYLRTAPSYPGNPILVRTPLADVRLHGTTVGVLVDEQGTCVCVAEGTARVISPRLPGVEQNVQERMTLRVFLEREQGWVMEPFAEGSGHTGDLVEFQGVESRR